MGLPLLVGYPGKASAQGQEDTETVTALETFTLSSGALTWGPGEAIARRVLILGFIFHKQPHCRAPCSQRSGQILPDNREG